MQRQQSDSILSLDESKPIWTSLDQSELMNVNNGGIGTYLIIIDIQAKRQSTMLII